MKLPTDIRPSVARLSTEVAAFNRVYRRLAADITESSGLTSVEVTLLRYLHRQERHYARESSTAGLRINDLAAMVHCSQSVVSRQISGLEKRNLTSRTVDPSDARATLITLTDAGRAELRDSLHTHLTIGETALKKWSDEEVNAVADAFARLNAEYCRLVSGDLPCDCAELGKKYRKQLDH